MRRVEIAGQEAARTQMIDWGTSNVRDVRDVETNG